MREYVRFPKYYGADDPQGWLHKCEQIFQSQGILASMQVWTAVFFLDGAAHQWYFRLEKDHGEPSWSDFVDGITKRFAT
jgi:hypothetical protein